MAPGHGTDVLVIPRSITRIPHPRPVPMSVEVGPNLEDLLVHGAQKKARDRISRDPECTIEGKSTNERCLGFTKRLHRHDRLEVAGSDAVFVIATLIADEKEGVHVQSERRRRPVRVVDPGPFSDVGPT